MVPLLVVPTAAGADRYSGEVFAVAQAEERPAESVPDVRERRVFDPSRDAEADVAMALGVAKARGVNALIVLGGDWCHDSRALAATLADPALAPLIRRNFEPVYVDVGRRNRNLDIPRRYGVAELIGTPTILIVSPGGDLINADTAQDWRNADSRSLDEAIDYFSAFASSGA